MPVPLNKTIKMHTLPHTSEQNYITGKSALNVPGENGFPADWHFHEVFLSGRGKIRIAGQDMPETNELLGSYGIRECGEVLRRCGIPNTGKVYAANHIRAILDMVISSIRNKKIPTHVTVHDMLDEPADVEELKKQVQMLQEKITDKITLSLLTQWEQTTL